jgi:hypothetical protein
MIETDFTPPSPATLAATTLTLDLGTHTGYAVGGQGTGATTLMQTAVCGTWELMTEKEVREQRMSGLERLGDARYYRLRDLVLRTCSENKVTRIVIEDVNFCRSAFQAQLWASLRTAVWEVRDRLGLELRAVPVPSLKTFACSQPHAHKTEMASALQTRAQEAGDKFSPGDDNEVDARWLLVYALAVDEGTQSWTFGWQLKEEKKKSAKAKKAERKLEQKERIEAARADGLNRLETMVRELGGKMPHRAARKAVSDLCRSKRHTLELSPHVIEGAVLKNGELRWRISNAHEASEELPN